MPLTRATRSPAPISDRTPARRSALTAVTGSHVIDRALAVHALLAAGQTPTAVRRRLSKSKGYVSVLGYLGAAVTGMEPDSVAALRTPAVTARVIWPLIGRYRGLGRHPAPSRPPAPRRPMSDHARSAWGTTPTCPEGARRRAARARAPAEAAGQPRRRVRRRPPEAEQTRPSPAALVHPASATRSARRLGRVRRSGRTRHPKFSISSIKCRNPVRRMSTPTAS